MDVKKILMDIVENANDKPACKNCNSYKNGGCSFGCLNEKVKSHLPIMYAIILRTSMTIKTTRFQY